MAALTAQARGASLESSSDEYADAVREPDPDDGRFTNAILTDKGFETLAEAVPGHVVLARSLVIDVLSPEQLRHMGRDADRIMSHIDTSVAT